MTMFAWRDMTEEWLAGMDVVVHKWSALARDRTESRFDRRCCRHVGNSVGDVGCAVRESRHSTVRRADTMIVLW